MTSFHVKVVHVLISFYLISFTFLRNGFSHACVFLPLHLFGYHFSFPLPSLQIQILLLGLSSNEAFPDSSPPLWTSRVDSFSSVVTKWRLASIFHSPYIYAPMKVGDSKLLLLPSTEVVPQCHWPLESHHLAQNQYLESFGIHILGQTDCEPEGCPWSLVTDQIPWCCRNSLLGSHITQINNSKQKSVLSLLWKLKLLCAQSSRNEHGCSASDFKTLCCSTQV